MKKYLLQHLIADQKKKWELFFIWIELGPTVISDAGADNLRRICCSPKILHR
jgi:hypothetical protein